MTSVVSQIQLVAVHLFSGRPDKSIQSCKVRSKTSCTLTDGNYGILIHNIEEGFSKIIENVAFNVLYKNVVLDSHVKAFLFKSI